MSYKKTGPLEVASFSLFPFFFSKRDPLPYLLTKLYLSSAYELAKDPALSFPAMETESMSCQV